MDRIVTPFVHLLTCLSVSAVYEGNSEILMADGPRTSVACWGMGRTSEHSLTRSVPALGRRCRAPRAETGFRLLYVH
jgi:hypothetical protein